VTPVFSDRTRLDASPSSGESMYAFLDRVAGPFWDRIRQLIEDWVNDYCPDDQAEMVARLRTKSDIDFTASYWELLLGFLTRAQISGVWRALVVKGRSSG
jgi:hypothetical protein